MEAARYWQKKFKWQCLCIFPCHGWTIYDLWDAADLHLDSHQFLFNVMKFIERDTWFAGRKFAEDWMLAHPDDVEFVVQTKIDQINQNTEHPLRIVETIFIYGEPLDFPRTFLYHVVNLIVIARDLRLAAEASGQEQQSSNEAVPGGVEEDMQEALGSTETAPMEQESQKARKHIHAATSSEVPDVTATASASGGPSGGIGHSKDHGAKPKRTADRGTSTTMMSPGNTHTQTMKGPREFKPQNTMGPNYSPSTSAQSLPMGGWVENRGRVLPPPPGLSGQYSRHPSGPASNMASPPMYPTATMAGIPTVYPPNLYQLYPHGNHMMPSNMSLYQHFDPTSNQAGGIFPVHPNPMHAGYIYQPQMHQPYQGSPGMRGVSMGNITNHMPYGANMGPQYGESSRGPNQRRSSNLNTSGSLYDPYEGTNTRFNNAAGQGMGRNFSQGASGYQGGRPHRPSAPGNRPFRAHLPYIKQMEDDTRITRNYRTGCDVTWIGPENQTVDELFVDYLPEGVKAEELKQMFEVETGVTPWSIEIRQNKDPGTFLNACSADVRFSSVSDARQALTVRDLNNHIRGGALAVGVTVPKKFYQRLVEYNKPEVRQGPFVNTQFFARGEPHAPTQQRASYSKPRYSPQDARSGLQKKTSQESTQGPEGKTSARDESQGTRSAHHHQKAPQAQAVTMESSKEAVPASGKVVEESKDNTVGNESSQVALDPASPKTGTTKVEPRVDDLIEPEKSEKENFHLSSTIAAVEVVAPETSASNTVTAAPQITTTPPVAAAPSTITASTGSPVIDNKKSLEVTTITAPKVTDTPKTAEVMPPQASTTAAASSKSNTEASKSEPPQKQKSHRKKAPKVKVPGSAAEGARSGESSSKALELRPKQASTAAHDELVAQAITQATISTPELVAPDAKDMIDTSSQPPQVPLANEPTTAAPKREIRQDSVCTEQKALPTAKTTEDFVESEHVLASPGAIEESIADPVPSSPAPARLVSNTASVSEVTNKDEFSSAGALAASEVAVTSELAQDTVGPTSEKTVDTSTENAKPVPTTSLATASEPKKKPGAQKSESYFPFAKGSKSQQKKEKEMKKKQQKKAELEKAEQAKVQKAQIEKAESSTKQNDIVQAKASTEPPQSPNKAGVETGSVAMPPKGSKKSKGKGKATVTSKADQSEELDIKPGQDGGIDSDSDSGDRADTKHLASNWAPRCTVS
ncbi:hypothetical protein IQ07DRAFT_44781 [Pyrenochaeta sp. DS3sAY3a]|nr:hypothetical protein IQ07DRAFT_44781 [Pyrenochaeta sp. DS3sAY3a]